MSDKSEHEMPDWPPRGSAVGLPDGEFKYGSTGQLFEVKNGQWIRARGGRPRTNRQKRSGDQHDPYPRR